MSIRTFLVLLLAVAVLTGCGRRGSLQAPGEPETSVAPTVSEPSIAPGGGTLLDAESPGSQEPAEARPVAAAPERPFFLDPLL